MGDPTAHCLVGQAGGVCPLRDGSPASPAVKGVRHDPTPDPGRQPIQRVVMIDQAPPRIGIDALGAIAVTKSRIERD